MSPADVAARLPSPEVLEERWRSLAALEIVLSPDWELRYFSFDAEWSDGERLGTIDTGSGNTAFAVFAEHGTVVRAFDHESDLSPWVRDDESVVPEILTGYPDHLRPVIDEPAFRSDDGPVIDLTFCSWWLDPQGAWRVGDLDDDGGAGDILYELLDDGPTAYRTFVSDYYEVEIDAADVAHALAREPIDVAWVERVNPDADPIEVLAELVSIGYPIVAP